MAYGLSRRLDGMRRQRRPAFRMNIDRTAACDEYSRDSVEYIGYFQR